MHYWTVATGMIYVSRHRLLNTSACNTLQDNGKKGINGASGTEPSSSGRDQGVSFDQLYYSLAKHMDNEVSVLLLYDLLHCNPGFKDFVIARG